MIYPYEHQADIKNMIGPGDFILFSDGAGINSGTVKEIHEDSIKIGNVNGERESLALRLSHIRLYRDTAWEE